MQSLSTRWRLERNDTVVDDEMGVAAELDRMSAEAARLAEKVRRLGRSSAVVTDVRRHQSLSVRQAAEICGVSDQGIRNWIMHANRMHRSIAEMKAGVWLVDTAKLLSYVERHRGGPASKQAAQRRLDQCLLKWSE
jgi:hypothetical protein